MNSEQDSLTVRPPWKRDMPRLLRQYGLPMLGILALYVFFIFVNLSKQDMDIDELKTSRLMVYEFGDLVFNRFSRGHPPLFFVTEWVWTRIVGHSYLALLTVSNVMGAISIFLMLMLGRELGLGHWVWAALLLWTLHPMVIFYSRYARPYAGVISFSVAELWLMLLILRRPIRQLYIAFFLLATIGAFWNHTLVLLMIGGAAAIALVPQLRRRTQPGFWIAWSLAFAFHLLMMGMVRYSRVNDHDPLGWLDRPSFGECLSFMLRFLGRNRLYYKRPEEIWVLPLGLIIAFGFVLWHSFSRPKIVRQDAENLEIELGYFSPLPRKDRWKFITLASVIPLIVLISTTFVAKPIFYPRYLIVLIPGFILCGARALSLIPYRPVSIIMLVCVLPLMGYEVISLNRESRSGVRETILQMEALYDPQRDIIMVINVDTIEAMSLFSHVPFRVFIAPMPSEKGDEWDKLHASVKGHERLWIFSWRFKGGAIMREPRWKSEIAPWNQFMSEKNDDTTLTGYELPES